MTGNPWKMTAIGMALVVTTALVTGVVVANRSKPDERPAKSIGAITPEPAARPATPAHATAPPAPAVPKAAVVKACNEQAATEKPPLLLPLVRLARLRLLRRAMMQELQRRLHLPISRLQRPS